MIQKVQIEIAAGLRQMIPGVPVMTEEDSRAAMPTDAQIEAALQAMPVGQVPKIIRAKSFKVGDQLFEASGNDDGSVDVDVWIVRSIRADAPFGEKVTAIMKASWTWGKRSKKNGDFGWLDPIASDWRMSWRQGNPQPSRLATTRRGAWVKLRNESKETLADDTNFFGADDKAVAKKWLATAERMVKRL